MELLNNIAWFIALAGIGMAVVKTLTPNEEEATTLEPIPVRVDERH